MFCPLCTANMKFEYRNLNDGHVRGYTDSYSCTSCDCVVDYKVTLNHEVHNALTGNQD